MLKLGVGIYELSADLTRDTESFGNFGKSLGRLHAKVAIVDRRYPFIGSMNFDKRSAWSNPESGLLIDSPPLSKEIYNLVANDRSESVYRLRLAPDSETIERVITGRDGKERVLMDEAHDNWLLRLKMFLLEPFASEELL